MESRRIIGLLSCVPSVFTVFQLFSIYRFGYRVFTVLLPFSMQRKYNANRTGTFSKLLLYVALRLKALGHDISSDFYYF